MERNLPSLLEINTDDILFSKKYEETRMHTREGVELRLASHFFM